MSVYTHDVLLEGTRRDDVLTWLSDPKNHRAIVDGAWDGLTEKGPGDFELTVKGGPRPRTLHYVFDHVDDEHGGRRVHVKCEGRRVTGPLHYSLRTMKPSTNTLVTLHADFGDSGLLGSLSEQLGLRKRLDEGFKAMLDNLHRAAKAAL